MQRITEIYYCEIDKRSFEKKYCNEETVFVIRRWVPMLQRCGHKEERTACLKEMRDGEACHNDKNRMSNEMWYGEARHEEKEMYVSSHSQ